MSGEERGRLPPGGGQASSAGRTAGCW